MPPSNVCINENQRMVRVAAKDCFNFGVPIGGLLAVDDSSPPAHAALLVPHAIGRDDGEREFLPLDHLFDGREIVRVGGTRWFTITQPAIPASADAEPVPLASGVVCRQWFLATVEAFVAPHVVPVFLLGRRLPQLIEGLLAAIQVVGRVLLLDDLREVPDLAFEVLLSLLQ